MKNEIKIRVRDLRKARNITQVQLARTLCVSKQSVSNWEMIIFFHPLKCL